MARKVRQLSQMPGPRVRWIASIVILGDLLANYRPFDLGPDAGHAADHPDELDWRWPANDHSALNGLRFQACSRDHESDADLRAVQVRVELGQRP